MRFPQSDAKSDRRALAGIPGGRVGAGGGLTRWWGSAILVIAMILSSCGAEDGDEVIGAVSTSMASPASTTTPPTVDTTDAEPVPVSANTWQGVWSGRLEHWEVRSDSEQLYSSEALQLTFTFVVSADGQISGSGTGHIEMLGSTTFEKPFEEGTGSHSSAVYCEYDHGQEPADFPVQISGIAAGDFHIYVMAGTAVRTVRSQCREFSPYSEYSYDVTNEIPQMPALGLAANYLSIEGVVIPEEDGAVVVLEDEQNLGTDLHTGLDEDFEGVWRFDGELRISHMESS